MASTKSLPDRPDAVSLVPSGSSTSNLACRVVVGPGRTTTGTNDSADTGFAGLAEAVTLSSAGDDHALAVVS